MKSSKGISLGQIAILISLGLFLVFIVMALLFPTGGGGGIDPSRKAQAKNDVTQIATAVTAFETEYGHLPPAPSDGTVSGELVNALLGQNDALNPRKIVFMEIGPAIKNKKSGLRDGVFVDPWGGAYQIAIATGTNNPILAGTNHIELRRKRVAVWNNANLNPDAASLSDAKKGRRYVTSWE